MLKKVVTPLFFSFVFTATAGCSSGAWYEGLQEAERQDCYKIESPAERQECQEKVSDMSYDQYKKEREALQK